ncbi:MAG: hypothetical protein DRP00_03010 [Candidatus Aenigmatarchaeota archaeon]|nr:MAG: hypothetical protein DRP00_03010 [Candidatus Aenigmarchaeota archaeon]
MTEELREQPAGEAPQEEEVKEQATAEAGEQQEAPQEEPEFFLDEEGNLQINLDDWGLEEPAGEEEEKKASAEKPETEEKTEETKAEPREEVQYYTPEELARLEFSQIDPSRVPPDLRPYYEAILRAEAQRKQEELKLQQQEQPQVLDEKQLYDAIQEEARKRVELKLGEKFDELNPKHLTALAIEAAKITQEVEKKRAVQRKINELKSQEPYFDQINEYIRQKLDDLPAREYKKIVAAIQNDDLETFLPFWERMRKEFYKEKLGKELQNESAKASETIEQFQTKKTAPEPPKVEGAGKGEVETPPQISPQDFARMSPEERAEALIKLGIV